VIGLARAAAHTLTWIVIGSLLAMALDPVVRSIERRLQIRRSLALAMVIVLVVAAANLLIVAFGPRAINEARDFGSDIPGVVERLGELPVVGGRLRQADASAKVAQWLQDLPSKLSNDPEPLVSLTRAVLGGALAAFMTVLVTVVLLLDGRRLAGTARRLVPDGRRARFDRTLDVVYRTVGRYFAGSLLLASLTGTALFVGGLAIGVPLTPMIAVWAAVTNLIPQIGGFLGGSMFVLLGLTQSPGTALACLVYFLVWQQIENHVLHPTIVGDAVNLSPPATLLAALIGGAAAGVPGALVAVPLLGAAKSVLLELRPDLAGPPRPRRTPAWRRVRNRFSRPEPTGNR
jgi:putative heme transporter